MKYTIICLSLLIAQTSLAQFKVDYIKSADTSRMFIRITSEQFPDAAKKINSFIQKDWGYNPAAKDPFENLMLTDEADFHYEIGVANTRIFSIIMESSYAAAGLHIDRRTYFFDSKTGAPVDNNKLFSPDGKARLKKALHKSWVAAAKAAAEDKNESRASEYKDCLTNDTATELEPNRMLILDLAIQFWAGYCLEGTAYDFEADRSPGPHTYSLGQLLPMLSQYGFSLFVDKGVAPLQTLLRGMVDGKYPMSLTLLPGKGDGNLVGILTYDRIGEPLQVAGTMNGNQFKFAELDANGNAVSDIRLTWDGTKLTGSFTNLKNMKQLTFEASPVK